MQSNKHRLFVVALVGLAFFTSCKKSDVTTGNVTLPSPTNPTPSGTTADALKDSALLYSKDIYLWYNQIPSSFNARSYSDIDKLMTAIRQYSTEPGFSEHVDKWSFAVKQADWE